MVDPLARGFDALQIALGIVFLLGGAPKLLGTERMRAMFDHLRVPQALRIIAGFIELGAGLGLLLGVLMQPWIGTAAAISASPLMFGTMMTNITRSRRRDAWLMSALVLFLCVLVAYVRSSAAGALAQRCRARRQRTQRHGGLGSQTSPAPRDDAAASTRAPALPRACGGVWCTCALTRAAPCRNPLCFALQHASIACFHACATSMR